MLVAVVKFLGAAIWSFSQYSNNNYHLLITAHKAAVMGTGRKLSQRNDYLVVCTEISAQKELWELEGERETWPPTFQWMNVQSLYKSPLGFYLGVWIYTGLFFVGKKVLELSRGK